MSIDKSAGYYDVGGIETLAILRAKLSPEQYVGFLLGNVIKYTSYTDGRPRQGGAFPSHSYN